MDKKKIILTSAAIVVVAGVAVWAFSGGRKKQAVEYETATVAPWSTRPPRWRDRTSRTLSPPRAPSSR